MPSFLNTPISTHLRNLYGRASEVAGNRGIMNTPISEMLLGRRKTARRTGPGISYKPEDAPSEMAGPQVYASPMAKPAGLQGPAPGAFAATAPEAPAAVERTMSSPLRRAMQGRPSSQVQPEPPRGIFEGMVAAPTGGMSRSGGYQGSTQQSAYEPRPAPPSVRDQAIAASKLYDTLVSRRAGRDQGGVFGGSPVATQAASPAESTRGMPVANTALGREEGRQGQVVPGITGFGSKARVNYGGLLYGGMPGGPQAPSPLKEYDQFSAGELQNTLNNQAFDGQRSATQVSLTGDGGVRLEGQRAGGLAGYLQRRGTGDQFEKAQIAGMNRTLNSRNERAAALTKLNQIQAERQREAQQQGLLAAAVGGSRGAQGVLNNQAAMEQARLEQQSPLQQAMANQATAEADRSRAEAEARRAEIEIAQREANGANPEDAEVDPVDQYVSESQGVPYDELINNAKAQGLDANAVRNAALLRKAKSALAYANPVTGGLSMLTGLRPALLNNKNDPQMKRLIDWVNRFGQ